MLTTSGIQRDLDLGVDPSVDPKNLGFPAVSPDNVSCGILNDTFERPHGSEESEIVGSNGFSHYSAYTKMSCCSDCVSSGVVGLMCSE